MTEYDRLEKGARSGAGGPSQHSLHHVHAHYTTQTSTSSREHVAAHARHSHHHTRSDSHYSHPYPYPRPGPGASARPLSNPGYLDEADEDKARRPRSAASLSFASYAAMSPKNIGRAIGARIVRGVKRGNLPFMLVFTM